MDHFSWRDSFQAAVGSCFSCLGYSPRHDANSEHGNDRGGVIPRVRSDELEGLLAESDDAETLSLHSNFGDRDRRRKKPHASKGIRLFGYDLFGRPPIHLPGDEEEERSQRERRSDGRTRTISTSTLDSDASPLDPSAIEELSAARMAEQATREEEERRAKAERRQRRRERKELKRAAAALAMAGDGDFEGFQGSGPAHGHIPSPFRTSTTGSSDLSSPFTPEEFGPFEHSHIHEDNDIDNVDAADFGAESYTRRVPNTNTTGSGSDSRSRTSASNSNADSSRFNHHYLSQQPLPSPHMLTNQPLSPFQLSPDTPKKKKKSKRDKASRQSVSATSQSTSLASPQQPSFPFASPPAVASPEADYSNFSEFIRPDVKPAGQNGFPSAGLPGGMRRKNSEAGVMLANRGNE